MRAEAEAQLAALRADVPDLEALETHWDPGAEVLRLFVPCRYPGLSWDRYPRVMGDETDLWFARPRPRILLHAR